MERHHAKRATAAIMATGFISAAAVFFAAAPDADFPLGYDPLTNKKYVLELERYGGKANVATAEFLQWFDGLWHGRTLAYTIAVLTVIVAGLFWVAVTMPPLEEEGGNAGAAGERR